MLGNKINIDISAGFFLTVSAALLILPLRFVTAWLVAASIHELAHILVLKDQVTGLQILPAGARIQTVPLTPRQEFKAALAGPGASLLLIGLLRIFPALGVCGFVHFFINMIPVFPMDGGRVIYCLCRKFWGINAAKCIMKLMYLLTIAVLILFCCYTVIIYKSIMPVVLCCVILIKITKGKIPCKYGVMRVQ